MLKKLLVLTCVLAVAAFAGTANKMAVPSWLEAVPHGFASTDVEPVATGNSVFFADADEAGTTTYDYQQNGAMGNRVVIDGDGNAHVCWMSSDGDFGWPDRAVDYNFWDAGSEAFAFSGGVQASGVNRAGYTTCGVMSNGRCVAGFHATPDGGETDSVTAVVAVDAAQGAGAFGTPVTVDAFTTGAQQVIWPHIVVGADDIIHVAGHINDTSAVGDPIYYSRSTDDGADFSDWYQVTDDAGDDPAIAVSEDGSKVCIAWMSQAAVNTGGNDFACGHIWYRESTNSGQSWGTATQITDGRYADEIENDPDLMWLFANNRDIDCAYDNNDDVVIAFMEGWHTWNDGAYYYPRMWARLIVWTPDNGFGAPTAYHPMFRAITEEGDTVWEFDSLGMWGVGTAVGEAHGGQYTPQLAITSGGNIVAAFGGQWDSLDLSGAGTVNGEIYATISDDGGVTWQGVQDWNPEDPDYEPVQSAVTNLTMTPAYGAGVGATMDEDYMTVWPWIGSDNILHISYVMDKFAGSVVSNEDCPSYGVITDNPFEYLRYPDIKVGVPTTGSIDEDPVTEVALEVSTVNSGSVTFNIPRAVEGTIKIYDAAGSLVETLEANSTTVTWDAEVSGIYFYSFVTPTATTNGKLVLVD